MVALITTMVICVEAAGQSVEAARATRDRAKADLLKAQEAFDHADEAYINALGGAAIKPAVATPAPTLGRTGRGSLVTFSMSGVGALDANPLDYRGRLISDRQPGDWTQTVSGVKSMAPPGTRLLGYEVQINATRDPINPTWKTICEERLPLKAATTVDIVIARTIRCDAR